MPSAKDLREFRGFLRNATDRQVQGIFDKEKSAGRDEYAELAVEEAERRGISLDDHATKKRRRPDRPLSKEAVTALQTRGRRAAADGLMGMRLDDQLNAEGLSRSEHRIVRSAFNIAVGAGDYDLPPHNHSTKKKSRAQLDREIAAALRGNTRTAHATTKRAIPGVAKWSMTAGGTGAAEGKHGYTFTVPEGTYRIWPFTTKFGRHAGYALKFSAEGGGRPRGSHGGLWHELGTHRSPAAAASAAATHYASGFD